MSDTSGSVGKVLHEDHLEVLNEHFLSKNETELCNEFEYGHSYSPLTVFGHASQYTHELRVQEVGANNLSNFGDTPNDVEFDLGAVILEEFLEDWLDLDGGILLTNDRGHLAEGAGNTGLELGGGIGVGILKGWKHQVANLFSR